MAQPAARASPVPIVLLRLLCNVLTLLNIGHPPGAKPWFLTVPQPKYIARQINLLFNNFFPNDMKKLCA